MELDSKIWFFIDLQTQKSLFIHNRWNNNSDWQPTLLAMVLYWTNSLFSAWNLYLWREKYDYCWKISSFTGWIIWKTYCIYWWWYVVYDEACNILRLKHYLHSSIEKSLMERVNQYLKDRIERVLMTTIYVCKKKVNAIYFMYITGYNSLCLYIMIQ